MKSWLLRILLAALLLVPGASWALDDVDNDNNNALDIIYGGTNATTALDARTNLAVPHLTSAAAGSLPGTCTEPQFFWATDTNYLYVCTASNTWARLDAAMAVDDLITLSGVALGSVNLATFTGTTIADNVTIKAALQALETALELKGVGTVTGVGDCASGACYDGTSDAGTYVRLWDGTSAYISMTGGVRTLTLVPSNTNAESLVITFGDNNNVVSLGSGTGASVSISGNAGTASALAADPADCAAGSMATAIAASGALTCGASWAAPGAIGSGTPAAGAFTTGTFTGAVVPGTDDTYALGSTSAKWSDLWLGSGAVVNWNAGDVLLTHSANTLAFTGGTSYTFDGPVTATGALLPGADDTHALGATGSKWADLWLGSGAVINWNAGDVLLTHSANTLAFTGGTAYTFDAAVSASSVGVTAATATGGILDLLEGSDNGTSYLRIQGQASMATTSGATLSSDITTESMSITLEATGSNKVTLNSASGAGFDIVPPSTITALEVDGSAHIHLTAAQVSRTIINNYGQAAANVILELPAATQGMTFIAVVGTAQAANYWRILAPAAIVYADVGAGLVSGKTYISLAAPAIGDRASCFTFRTAAATWSWMCGVNTGTWTTD